MRERVEQTHAKACSVSRSDDVCSRRCPSRSSSSADGGVVFLLDDLLDDVGKDLDGTARGIGGSREAEPQGRGHRSRGRSGASRRSRGERYARGPLLSDPRQASRSARAVLTKGTEATTEGAGANASPRRRRAARPMPPDAIVSMRAAAPIESQVDRCLRRYGWRRVRRQAHPGVGR